MIPQKTVQEILEATRIEDVVEEFVTLRRRGTNLVANCPFHNEKSPSFSVNPVKNIFKCFGCGKGGDAISFLKEHENFTYLDSLRWLAKKYNIKIEEVQLTAQQLAEQQIGDSMYIINEFAQKLYTDNMFQTDIGRNVGLSYFQQRGFTDETIQKWGLGYAPDSRDFLIQKSRENGYAIDLIKKLGLSNKDGNFDFFRGRVIFPIHGMSGKPSAFAGRILGKVDNAPKYINSPETEIYNKSKTLYGFHLAKKAIRQLDECILTEGYTDVISLHQAGVENVVASSGTSLTVEQIQLIRRNTENIRILYDGDAAGIKAALRGLDLVLEQGLNVKIVLLPDGEDPDSFVQRVGQADFRKFITETASDFILFKSKLLLAETAGDPIKRSNLVKDIVGTIAKIPDPIKRSFYIKECSSLLTIQEEILIAETGKLIATSIKKADEKAARAPRAASDSDAPPPPFPIDDRPYDSMPHEHYEQQNVPPQSTHAAENQSRMLAGDEFQEKEIIRILIRYGSQLLENEQITVGEFILNDISESLGSFDNALYGKFAQECFELLKAEKPIHQNHFLVHENRELSKLAINLLADQFDYSTGWEEKHNYPLQNQPMPDLNFTEDMRQALNRFKLRKVMKMGEINQQRIKQAEQSGENEDLTRYIKVHQKLLEMRSILAKKAGTVVFK